MVDSACYSTQIHTPKAHLENNTNSIEILELQNKVDNLYLLDVKISEIARKANGIIHKSEETRNNVFADRGIEANSIIESSDEEDSVEGMYYGNTSIT
jgi:hypothetical protein